MQNDLIHKRCANHEFREAVARCPGCGRYFCRECVTEHEDRVLCTPCLRKQLKPSYFRRLRFGGLWSIAQFALGISVAWIFFFYIGQGLLSLPDSFHEGTLWQESRWE